MNRKIIKIIICTIVSLPLVYFALLYYTFSNFNDENMNYYYPSPDKRYTAVVSENESDYFIHIKPEITKEYFEECVSIGEVPKEEKFFSKYAYGKNGSLVIEWEKEHYNLWIWSGDIGLYLIRKNGTSWEEFPYDEVKSEIDINSMPEQIREKCEKWF